VNLPAFLLSKSNNPEPVRALRFLEAFSKSRISISKFRSQKIKNPASSAGHSRLSQASLREARLILSSARKEPHLGSTSGVRPDCDALPVRSTSDGGPGRAAASRTICKYIPALPDSSTPRNKYFSAACGRLCKNVCPQLRRAGGQTLSTILAERYPTFSPPSASPYSAAFLPCLSHMVSHA
jgi:hypothetical protein